MSARRARPPRAGRVFRFLLEVAFLGGLAALAALARMRTEAVIGVMAFGWLVVALAEWAAWLDRPHFGRGLPPRYAIPQTLLPAPLIVEQTALHEPLVFPPEEAETRIALAGSWPTAFEQWPAVDLERLGAAGTPLLGEDTEIAAPTIVQAAAPELAEAAPPAARPPAARPARHRIDPFAPATPPSRWRGRGSVSVELPARPPEDRPPPREAGAEAPR